ncbi:hypothetical protein ACQKM2_13185 [Streptomyces sp. NPDC004126]
MKCGTAAAAPLFRGRRVPFGDVVAVDPGARAIDRLVAWAGRRP